MAYRFEFEPRALDEADAFYARIAEHSVERAGRWYRGLFERIDGLRSFPLRCPVAPEARALGVEVRELLYGKRHSVYRVLFEVRGDLILILSVRHSATRPEDP